MDLPESVLSCPWSDRLAATVEAVRGAASALTAVRRSKVIAEEIGDQLKTSVDRAAEGWVLGFLEASFPDDAFLAEERFSLTNGDWKARADYWTVDALDGTRSFVEGFPGFCVQVAWVETGKPRLGVIAEPVTGAVYLAAEGAGAFRVLGASVDRIAARRVPAEGVLFVDSTRPRGTVGSWMDEVRGGFVECGSIGLKIARVAEGAAHVYAKDFRFRLWDVAPGHVLAEEAGARVGLWDGSEIPFGGAQVEFRKILTTARGDYDSARSSLNRWASSAS